MAVSRLKKTLAVCGDQFRLSRQAGRYLIDVDPDAVDLHRFRRLVRAARSVADEAEVVTLYRSALALWRGAVFDGILASSPVLKHPADRETPYRPGRGFWLPTA